MSILKEEMESVKEVNGNQDFEQSEIEKSRSDKLKNIYKELFGIVINEENANLSFKKLGIDSLQVVTLLVEIQEQIGCDLYDSDVDLMKLRTFNDLVAAMHQCH